jgi:glycosyltransferase involved in cell wall biosynthesis
MTVYEESPYKQDIFIVTAAPDEIIRKAYIGASVLLFPSLAEGFGWPIAEAMASGCIVVTTQEAPMTEIGADTVKYIPRQSDSIADWQNSCALILEQTLAMPDDEKNNLVNKALERVKLFEPEFILDQMEAAYKKILTP